MTVATLGLILGILVGPAASDSASDLAKKQQKILKQLTKEKDPEMRQIAVRELAEMGGPEALAALTAALKDPSSEVRQSVVEAFARMKGANSIDPLVTALKDPAPQVRAAAAGAFADRKDAPKDVVAPLKAVLSDDEPLVRYNALAALSNMHATTPDLAPVIGAFLNDRDEDRRRQGLSILMELGASHEEVRAVLRTALAEGDSTLRRQILSAFQKDGAVAGSESWAKEVAAGLAAKDPDPDVRTTAQAVVSSISEFLKSKGYRACRLVTPEEAALLLGPKPKLQPESSACYYIAADDSLQLLITTWADTRVDFFQKVTRPSMKEKGYAVQDEPTLPRGSFSGRKRDGLDFHVIGKTATLELGLLASPDSPKEISAVLFEKLRQVAAKAVTRLN